MLTKKQRKQLNKARRELRRVKRKKPLRETVGTIIALTRRNT